MTARTLAIKMAMPVACLDCDWIGKTEELWCRGGEPAGTMRCAKCGSTSIKWIQNDAPAAVQ